MVSSAPWALPEQLQSLSKMGTIAKMVTEVQQCLTSLPELESRLQADMEALSSRIDSVASEDEEEQTLERADTSERKRQRHRRSLSVSIHWRRGLR